MVRLARVVIPGHPHHVTQRGNGRARTFFGDGDYVLYRDLLAENGVTVTVHKIIMSNGPDDELSSTRNMIASMH